MPLKKINVYSFAELMVQPFYICFRDLLQQYQQREENCLFSPVFIVLCFIYFTLLCAHIYVPFICLCMFSCLSVFSHILFFYSRCSWFILQVILDGFVLLSFVFYFFFSNFEHVQFCREEELSKVRSGKWVVEYMFILIRLILQFITKKKKWKKKIAQFFS